ncbi:polymorphic toxin-type HINT domain-containing protein [Kitasatospora kazusensis]|uniref:polymorphic toxin-type HINT domain-containing protein n=1 Tax=Kitasatospora kazusensis TaxID=407974 RepID=UPI0031D1119D
MGATAVATAASLVVAVAPATAHATARVAADAVSATELAYYPLSDGSGTTAHNYVPGADGALSASGTRWDFDGWADTQHPDSLYLDGSAGQASTPVPVATDRSFAVAAWVSDRTTPFIPPAARVLLSEDGSQVSGFALKMNADRTWQFSMPTSDSANAAWDTAAAPSPTPAPDPFGKPTWMHLTGVYDAAKGEIRLYVNGTKVASAPHTSTWKASGGLQIGRGLSAGAPADHLLGDVQEVHAWQGTLTDADITRVVAAPSAPDYMAQAAKVRDAVCRLGYAFHTGGPAVKAAALAGLSGSDAQKITASTSFIGPNSTDRDAALAKTDELNKRHDAWNSQLAGLTGPPARSDWDFQHSPDFGKEIGGFYGNRIFLDDLSFTDAELSPRASQTSVDAAVKVYNARYGQDTPANAGDRQTWENVLHPKDPTKPLQADDYRMFLQYGGFPTAAPAPGSVDFRTDVEALKVRFAGCTSTYPIDPHNVLKPESMSAAAEWKAELDAQAGPRADILAAESIASADLATASEAMVEAVGRSWTAGQLTKWQAYWLNFKPKDSLSFPKPAIFDQVKRAIADDQNRAKAQLDIANKAAAEAQSQAAKVTAAQATAGAIAAANNTPYGRGLAYAQQSAQVAKASAAAAQAAAKSTETAYNATKANSADSAALVALAQTQAHGQQAEFQRAAAQEAADQAHTAAVAAKAQAAQAAQQAARAHTDRATAEKAEQTARDAAGRAAQQQAVAEQERGKAAQFRATADSERAKAGAAEATAKSQDDAAQAARDKAQAAAGTAATKRSDAEAAEAKAATARNTAWDSEARRDALAAKAAASEAAAAAADGTQSAADARSAATQARAEADDAGTAATAARAAAVDATTAAVAARQAATEATGAADRSQAAANAAGADAATTKAQAATAHSAAADAINATDQANGNANIAQAMAGKAKTEADAAKADAAAARAEADQAQAGSAVTAGQAYAAALAASAAGDSAAAVTRPANDAIALGTPFRETDSSAGLAVLVGQDAKTFAQQQDALAKAKAAQATQAAKDAAAAAAKADKDAKAAAQSAATAASEAANALQSAADAHASAAAAATDAAAAAKADADTAQLNAQAQQSAAAAATAAAAAAGDAAAARNSATAAEQDAASARQAASAATTAADQARAAATQADKDATAAEQAAANARQSAEQAQQAAQQADAQQAQTTLSNGGASGIAHMFTQQKIVPLEDPKPENDCVVGFGNSGCDVTFTLHFSLTIDFYVCDDPSAPGDVTAATCPAASITWLGNQTSEQTAHVKKHFSTFDLAKIIDTAFLKGLWVGLTDDFVNCSKGSVSGCLWAASWFVPPAKIAKAADLARALDAALVTGVGVTDAFKALKALDLDAKALAAIEAEVHVVEDALGGCLRNSFTGDTQVLMADGSHKAIRSVRIGDRLTATDPATGELRAEPVTAAFAHGTEHLVDISLADSGRLTSTTGHRVYVTQRGWVFASELRTGDLLRAEDGTVHAVSALRDRDGLAPQTVYDLTVDGLHTFYVRTAGARPQDLLVHNCNNLAADGLNYPDLAHTLTEHVNVTPEKAIELAEKKLERGLAGINGVFIDEQLAQQVTDYGIANDVVNRPRKLANWLSGSSTANYEIPVIFGAKNSIGTMYKADGSFAAAGNRAMVVLKKMPGHSRGYIVLTAFPVG